MTPALHTRVYALSYGMPGTVISVSRSGLLVPRWRYLVRLEDGREVRLAGEHLMSVEPMPMAEPFRLHVVGGTDFVEPDLLPSEVTP